MKNNTKSNIECTTIEHFVPPLSSDVPTSRGNENESKNLFISLKNKNVFNVPPCTPLNTIKDLMGKEENKGGGNLCALHIANIINQRGNTEQISVPQYPVSYALNTALYSHAEVFLPAWISKWDAALANKDWPKIKTLVCAAYKHAGYAMPLPELTQWWPEQTEYWVRVDIRDKDGNRHITPHLAIRVMAENSEQAMHVIDKSRYVVKGIC